MRIAVFGAGALGSLFGGLLARAHDVLLVGRDPHMGAVAEDGLRIEAGAEGTDDLRVRPRAGTRPPEDPQDLVLVTVKAFDTADAAGQLAPLLGPGTLVVSLQNGLGNLEALAERIAPERLVAAVTSHGATHVGPGVVRHGGVGDTTVGAWAGGETAEGRQRAETVARAFEAAGIDAEVTGDVRRTLWEKVLVNAAINPLTALARVKNGVLLQDAGLRACLAQLAEEGAAVARAAGHAIAGDDAAARAMEVARRTADNRSSMLQDVEKGRRTEVDAINGAIARTAAEHGVAAPMNGVVVDLLAGPLGAGGPNGPEG